MAEVTETQAEAVRAEVARVFHADAIGSPPTLLTDFNGHDFVIVWEEGPYEWTYRFPYGGVDEETTEIIRREFGKPDYTARTQPAVLPDGIWTEAINHYSIAVYPQEP